MTAEISDVDSGDSVRDASVAIHIGDVHVVHNGAVVEVTPAAIARAPPPVERFKRSQRHPAHIAKTEAKASAAAPSEEPD
jgi:hypothetical protein